MLCTPAGVLLPHKASKLAEERFAVGLDASTNDSERVTMMAYLGLKFLADQVVVPTITDIP